MLLAESQIEVTNPLIWKTSILSFLHLVGTQFLIHLGDGCRIHFPVEMKSAIRWSKKLFNREDDGTLKLKKRYVEEKVYMRLVKYIV